MTTQIARAQHDNRLLGDIGMHDYISRQRRRVPFCMSKKRRSLGLGAKREARSCGPRLLQGDRRLAQGASALFTSRLSVAVVSREAELVD